jgi:hypothetical protein
VFDLRYHVASLAAVFIALIVGIVVGVGLSESGVADKADLQVAQRERDDARAELADAQAQLRASAATREALRDSYPALMEGRLAGKRIAILFVGQIDPPVRDAVERTLSDADAPLPVRVRALNVPIDVEGLVNTLAASDPELAQFADTNELSALGRALAAEFVHGGETPLWNLLSTRLVEERSGGLRAPVDGVVVVRNVKPQMGDTARFLNGLISGVAAQGVPAVGVEESDAEQSAVSVFANRGLSTVDDIDLSTGRLALALLLAGAAPGQYGINQETADDGVLPPVEPVPSVAD